MVWELEKNSCFLPCCFPASWNSRDSKLGKWKKMKNLVTISLPFGTNCVLVTTSLFATVLGGRKGVRQWGKCGYFLWFPIISWPPVNFYHHRPWHEPGRQGRWVNGEKKHTDAHRLLPFLNICQWLLCVHGSCKTKLDDFIWIFWLFWVQRLHQCCSFLRSIKTSVKLDYSNCSIAVVKYL